MNLLDLIIILAAVAYGVGGFRNGAVVGALSMIGFFTGAVIGAQLAGPLGSRLAHGQAQIPVAIVCVLVLSMSGQVLGVWVAGHIKSRVVRSRGRKLDSGVGLLLGVVSVLLVAWMVAVPLASSPYPALSSAASHSTIVRGVDDVMPDDVRSIYSSLRTFLDRSGFPPVFGDLPAPPSVNVPPPAATLTPAVAARVRAARPSVLKIYGQAPSCSRGIEGSGFVFAPHRVMTNAHVVAGTREVQVETSPGHRLSASVVVYDPKRDVAVLDVPNLAAPALAFATKTAASRDPAVVLGYPENGPFTVRNARVGSRTTVSGTDIYGRGNVDREIYVVRSIVRSGNSGGPLLADNGTVLGVVFATARDSSDTGYVLTDKEVSSTAAAGSHATTPVATGSCTPD